MINIGPRTWWGQPLQLYMQHVTNIRGRVQDHELSNMNTVLVDTAKNLVMYGVIFGLESQ